ncbi:hypothetical protein DFA_03374 [Cavenderia fasciculata]|uniref:Transmembrane protein n=1 Tax=Cavenderia fasciculata TaxID=261658 RepID=F4PHE3_CACFS|nr:uncharacterized protein DFA_03374 [Cavenderia fasciculata]EGG25127.1 hypothetical protein DFA_03374 [Cavenderia fasciculata]|eukprot:XP_004362978.1 hypothetical protein DFA_03374 [Cavenderia fasciculata]
MNSYSLKRRMILTTEFKSYFRLGSCSVRGDFCEFNLFNILILKGSFEAICLFTHLEKNALALIAVGMIWGCTNPFIKRGSEGVSSIKKNSAVMQFISEFIYLWTKPTYFIPMVINLSGSIVFFYTLGHADISLVVPISNSLTFLFTAFTGMLLKERLLGWRSYVGMLCVLTGVTICVAGKTLLETSSS